MPREVKMLPYRRRNPSEQIQWLVVPRCQAPVKQSRQQHRVVGVYQMGNQPATLVADVHIQVGTSGKFFTVNLGDSALRSGRARVCLAMVLLEEGPSVARASSVRILMEASRA